MADQNFRVKRGLEVGIGATVLVAQSSGNIGINSTTPEERLTVYHDGDAALFRNQDYSVSVYTTTPRIRFGTDTAYAGYMEIGAYTSVNNLDTKNRDFKLFSTAVDPILYAQEDTGNVGIGTDNPLDILHISDSTPVIRLTDTDTNLTSKINAASGNLYFDTASTTRFHIFRANTTELVRITGDGDVGIGTDNPTKTLDVVGYGTSNGIRVGDTHFFAFDDSGSANKGSPTFQNLNPNGNTILRVLPNGTGKSQFEFFATDYFANAGIGTTTWNNLRIFADNNLGEIRIDTSAATEAGVAKSISIETNVDPGGGTRPNQYQLYLDVNGNVGIGTDNPSEKLDVIGTVKLDGLVFGVGTTVTSIDTDLTTVSANDDTLASAKAIKTYVDNQITAQDLDFAGGTGTGAVDLDSQSLTIAGTANEIETSASGQTLTIGLPNDVTIGQDLTVNRDVQINRNLNVDGNITIGGTSATLFTQTLTVADSDLVLGIRTDGLGNDISNDTTANHGGIAIASTEGNPLITIVNPGAGETLPATYKKIMWFKSGSFAGLGTDAWLSNYAIGIGSTQVPNGVRLAAGDVHITENDISKVRDIDASGIITATTFSGSGSGLTNLPASSIVGIVTDSNLLDGLDSTQFLRSDADDTTTGNLIIDTNSNSKHLYISRSGSTSQEYTRMGRDDTITYFYTKNDESISTVRFTFDNTDTESGGGANANNRDIDLISDATNARILIDSNVVWHAGNDGSGSGLDADTLDTLEASQFLRSDADDTMDGILTLGGTSVSGNEGGELKLTQAPNSNLSGNQVVIDQYVDRIRFFEVGSPFKGAYLNIAGLSTNVAARILTTDDEGSGNGLDADTLDTLEASQFLRSDADDTTTNTITVSNSAPQFIFSETDTTTAGRLVLSGGIFYIQAGANGSGASSSSGIVRITGYNAQNINAFTVRYNGNDETIWHAGNDGTGSGLDADTLDGIEASSFLRSDADDTTTGQIQITKANNTATGGGQIYLNGATGNRIDFNTSGVAAPAFTTRSVGTKLVLYPAVSGSSVDYAFGIDGGTLWYSVPNNIDQHRFYAGTTQLADLKGSGELVIGSTSLTGTANQKLQVNSGAYFSQAVGIGYTAPGFTLAVNGSGYFNTNLIGTNVLAGTQTLTGTANQKLQVDGGAYVSANLGVGVTNPESRLEIYESTGTDLRLNTAVDKDNSITFAENGINYFRILHDGSGLSSPNNVFKIQTGTVSTGINNDAITIKQSGDVGIGTDSPSQKLDVNGALRLRGALYDGNNQAGSSGQVLSSTATGIDWVDAAPSNAIAGISIYDETSLVGTANSVSTLYFVGPNVTATSVGSAATITVADYVSNSGIATNLKGGTAGDIPYQTAADTTTFLADPGAGGNGYMLTWDNGNTRPAWAPAAPASAITGLSVRDEGSLQGSANSVTILDIVGDNVSAAVGSGIATITVSDTPTFDTLNVTGVSTFQGNVNLGDNDRLRFGDGNDLQIYHDATNSYIDNTTGDLWIRTVSPGDDINVRSADDITIQNNGGTNAAIFKGGAGAWLYYSGDLKFETVGTGVSVFGNLYLNDTNYLSSLPTGDFGSVQINGAGKNTWQGYSIDGRVAFLHNGSTQSGLFNDVDNHWLVKCFNSGGAELYHNGDKKLETTSYGIYVTGTGNTSTIGGAANLVLDPSTVGDNTGTVTILGNLQVEGTQTIINSTTLEVDDKLVSIAKSATNATQADGAGLEINGASATLTYVSTPDSWEFNKDLILDTTDATLKIKAGATGTRGAVDFTFNTDSTLYGSLELDYDTRATYGLHLKTIAYPITLSSATNQDIKFRTGTTERVRIEGSTGNVGIGTDNPAAKLNVEQTTEGEIVRFRASSDTRYLQISSFDSGFNGSGFDFNATSSAGEISFSTSSNEKVRINNAGNVGIGTDDPGAKLDVNGTLNVSGISTFDSAIILKGQTDNADGRGDRSGYWNYDDKVALVLEPAADDGAVAILFPSIGNATSDFAYIVYDENYGEAGIVSGENGALILGAENDGGSSSDHVRVKARLVVEADQSSSDPIKAFQVKSSNVVDDLFCVESAGDVGIGTNNPTTQLHISSSSPIIRLQDTDTTNRYSDIYQSGGALYFDARDGSSNGSIIFRGVNPSSTEYARITSAGNVGINSTTPTEKLDVVGTVKATDFNTTSDQNLKTNIQTIENPLDKIVQIRGVNFEWKENNKPSAGVIAQEVEKVLPQLVNGEGTKTVNYNGLIGLLIEAVKAQQEEINMLKERLK